MSHPRFSLHTVVLVLALAALLIVGLTLVVIAQDPDNPDSSIAQKPGDRDVPVPPDQVTVVEEPELLPDPSAPDATIHFTFISANTFVPDSSSMTYDYYTAGCMYRTGGSGRYTDHTLQLPQGAEITYLRVYFYDNDASNNATASLRAYDGSGGSTTIATASSSGQAIGYRDEGSGYFSHIVDNGAESLSLVLYYGSATTSELRICGVRIRYEYTLSITDLPLVLNGFGP